MQGFYYTTTTTSSGSGGGIIDYLLSVPGLIRIALIVD